MSKPKPNKSGGGLIIGIVLVLLGVVGWFRSQLATEGSVIERASHWWPLISGSVVVVLVLAGLWGLLRWSGRRSPGRLIKRWEKGSNTNDGLATRRSLLRGRWELIRTARVVRPTTYGSTPWWKLLTVPWHQLGSRLAKVGRWIWIYSTWEYHQLYLGPSGVGKTLAGLANQVVDAPGAVVVTSTKLDIVELTLALRRTVGPVYFFNPLGLGGDKYKTNISWNPVAGCEVLRIAKRRAGELISGSPTASDIGDTKFWTGRSVSMLGLLLHAAALTGGTALDVRRWVSNMDETEAEVLDRLKRSPSRETVVEEYRGLVATNDRSRSSVTMSGEPGLEWLSDPALAQIALVPRDQQFNIREFQQQKGTLYMIAPDGDSGVGSLFTALTSTIRAETAMMASTLPGLRLDPPLTMVLGEAIQICPVPLPEWIRDSRSSGAVIIIEAQDMPAMEVKYGEQAATSIWTGTASKVIFGGIDDVKTLQKVVELSGHKVAYLPPAPGSGSTAPLAHRVPVLSPDFIRALGRWQVLIVQRSQRLVLARVVPIVERKDIARRIKAAERQRARQLAAEARIAAEVDDALSGVEVPAQAAAAEDSPRWSSKLRRRVGGDK